MIRMDGLRYILASLVAYSHIGAVIGLLLYDDWFHNVSILIYNTGSTGVALFFIISGYLFGGLKADHNWLAFFIQRIFRIAPIYLISIFFCITISAYLGYKMGNTMDFHAIFSWLNLGLHINHNPIWGYKYTYLINSGVAWTLSWEWKFYFTVPFVSILIPKEYRLALSLFMLAIIIIYLKPFLHQDSIFIMLFIVGFCIKNIPHDHLFESYQHHKSMIEILACILFVFLLLYDYPHYSTPLVFLFSIFFFFIISGVSLFGLLCTSGFVKLGKASYSIYLLHGIFWFILNKILIHFDLIDNLLIRYLSQTLVWLLICFVSLQTYRFIEEPAIRLGKKIKITSKNTD